MAVFREKQICPKCGGEIKRKHLHDKPWDTFIGDDTYLDWNGHKCNLLKKALFKIKRNAKHV